jgi:hypothetical protein
MPLRRALWLRFADPLAREKLLMMAAEPLELSLSKRCHRAILDLIAGTVLCLNPDVS